MGWGAESVTHWARPNAIPIIARVTRNDGIFTKATRLPLMRPMSIPARMPQWEIAMAVTTETSPATEPTERSISASAMTKVIPTAITPTMALCRRMFMRFPLVRKPRSSSTTANRTKVTANARYMMYCPRFTRLNRPLARECVPPIDDSVIAQLLVPTSPTWFRPAPHPPEDCG